ncbi:MMPL family transporter [Bacillus aquiflavi]|uniref:MMPL family transporter n=1 Tax=Bacillus aquiflavi TaxID=2672567 RepID=A0A6B3W0J3_9BACI|nr:MMPL family transporter [Bacillus aquiflavi]MBA4538658.1 MMPL family transporter [Bacillus aquiflavi]NEY83018.1 MMPL family transporter [Bacillus aquiflavi]
MSNSSLKGKRLWWWSVGIWLVVMIVLSGVAPGGKEFAEPLKNSGLPADSASIIADRQLEKYFPQDEGMPLFAVFHDEKGLSEEAILKYAAALEEMDMKSPYGTAKVIPLTKLKPEQRASFISEDKKTFFIPVTIPNDLEAKELNTFIKSIKKDFNKKIDHDVEVSWTGPAGIATDAIELFSSANVVLLLSTIGLILVLLLIIYRSPLLTLIPLLGAAIVYAIVDRLIGLTASWNWFNVENQALSIMTILLFAVVTDYSLLIFSRYREELKTHESVNEAMHVTMRGVREPIFFSGSTILTSMATLFFVFYEPYRNFAPVFIIATVVMLLAGLTLLPAMFALFGRKAFWPIIPKYGEATVEKTTIWGKVANAVIKKPIIFMVSIMLLLLLGTWNASNLEESYDLIQSFPEDLSSRVGYERLGEAFSEGNLAPGNLLFVSDKEIDMQKLQEVVKKIEDRPGIDQVTVQGNPITADSKSAKFSVTFEGNPYEKKAFETVNKLRDESDAILKDAGFENTQLFVAGETAKNADLTKINAHDTWLVMIAMTILITVMLGLQTRSVIAPIYMVGTILLSFAATMGLSIFLFKLFLDVDAISYRLPLYSFVFLVALGVDYSIMLIARIREEIKLMPFKDAVRRGLEKTGGVISSAGLILAATFLVLATMPIYELKLFGFIMAIGILIDTFIVRPLLIPSILMLLGKYSFWPKKINN